MPVSLQAHCTLPAVAVTRASARHVAHETASVVGSRRARMSSAVCGSDGIQYTGVVAVSAGCVAGLGRLRGLGRARRQGISPLGDALSLRSRVSRDFTKTGHSLHVYS